MAVMLPRLLGAVVGLVVAGTSMASGASLYAGIGGSLYTINTATGRSVVKWELRGGRSIGQAHGQKARV